MVDWFHALILYKNDIQQEIRGLGKLVSDVSVNPL